MLYQIPTVILNLHNQVWKLPENIYERHIILTKMLTMIGVDEETAAADACKMEHYISEKSFNAIKEHMQKHPAKP